MKTCSKCKQLKGTKAFSCNRRTLDGLDYYCRSCNSIRFKNRRTKYNAWRRKQRRKLKISNPAYSLLESTKYRARKKGLKHNLSLHDIVIPKRCPVLGIPIFVGKGKQIDNSPSIDRIDNTKGYIKGNIAIVSWRVNDIKKNATLSELQKIVAFYKHA